MLLWQLFFDAYGADYLNVAITDGMSQIADVVWRTVMGAMLPFILRSVATMANVSGIVIYLGTARLCLHGGLLPA
jgi:magnesium transporter